MNLAGSNWRAGVPLCYLRELCNYWADEFDWRFHEAMINKLPHFKASIEGIEIHYLHVRGRGLDPFPLVLTHGWPSSFFEFSRLIPLLTDPMAHGADAGDAFDVVVPALPGYPFSEPQRESGVFARLPSLWRELMCDVLGYRWFGAHGGDIGAVVSASIGREFPEDVVGIHVLAVFGALEPDDSSITQAERNFLERRSAWALEEGGYSHQQQTRPQTLAYGLSDSPAGLAAWMIEKYRAWSGCDWESGDGPTFDELLVTPTLYWASNSIATSFLPYLEARDILRPRDWGPVTVPVAVALFPADLPVPPREFAERSYNIQRWTAMPRGGHFAAFEEPLLLAEDLREFFRPLRRTAR